MLSSGNISTKNAVSFVLAVYFGVRSYENSAMNVMSVYLQGLSTGGNVSAALDYMANSVCYQSIKRSENNVYILGESILCCVSVSDQIAQLEALIEKLVVFLIQ